MQLKKAIKVGVEVYGSVLAHDATLPMSSSLNLAFTLPPPPGTKNSLIKKNFEKKKADSEVVDFIKELCNVKPIYIPGKWLLRI